MSTEIIVNNDIIEINVCEEPIIIEAPSGAYPLPSGVYSVYGRTGNVIAEDGDYNLTQLGDVTITSPSTNQVLTWNGTTWVNTTQTNWDTAYNRSLTSAAVTGTTTKTLTLNEQGGGTITASWTDINTDAVTSVFGRTGAVTAQSGDYNTLQVTENTNLYFTNQRARYAISGDSNSGVVYSNTTGIIALDDIPNTSLLHDSITINGYTTALGGSVSLTTSDVAEGTNLYFTNARAQSAISGTSPISVSSGLVSISQSGPSTNGYLSSADWNTFNGKQSVLTLGNLTSSDITVTGGTGAVIGSGSTLNLATVNYNVGSYGDSTNVPTITVNAKGLVTSASQTAIPTASSSTTGLLTSSDWSAFDGKQPQLNGTGFVKVSGTTVSYDNSTYLTTISGITAGGELSGTYANPSLVNSAVTGKVLTGVNITGGTIQATDSILTAFGKVQNQINGLIGGSIYKGTWNASTNTPSLASGVGTQGWYYIVNVAGSTNLDGITDWNVGDWAIFDGTAWQQVDNTDAVVSVNGQTGAVSLTTSNISEGSNLYYTDARSRGSISAGTGISYSSSTGVITNSAPDQTVTLSGAGTTSISGTYPSFTITSNDQYTGTVTSVGITESSAALSITGSPVTTSGNINIGFAGSSSQYVAGDGSLVTFPSVISQASNLVTEVYNETGSTLTKGTIVYINGGHGNLPTVTKALATSDSTSAQTYGWINADLTNNNNGYVTVIGSLDNMDTQAYAAGTQLYLSGTTAGAYTSTKPSAPIHLVYVGVVIRSHPTQGVIEVKIQNGYELNELHDVAITSPANGNILQYNSSTSLWANVAGTTTNISEGTNLYYTDARARAALTLTTTGSSGASTYNSTTGALNVPTYTLAGLGGINLSSLSATSPLAYNNTTGVFSIQQSSGSQAGYLSSADWTTFNSKQAALSGTGFVKISGSTISYDNSTYLTTSSAASTYLPLTGGTITGDLKIDNGAADGGQLVLASSGFSDWNIDNFSSTLRAYYGSIVRFSLTNAGAATFSSSVTGNRYIVNGTNGNSGQIIQQGDLLGTAGTNLLIQSSTGNSIGFLTNGGTTFNMFINTSGNVGIGTTSLIADSLLPIQINAATSSQAYFASNNNGGYGLLMGYDNANGYARIRNVSNTALTFETNNSEKVRITNTGNVGIGTTSAINSNRLTVLMDGATNATGIAIKAVNDGGGGSQPALSFYNGSGNYIAQIVGDNGTGYLGFNTGTGNSERMRITSGGNVLVGTTNGQDARLTLNYSGGVDWAVGPKSGTSAFVINASSGGAYLLNGGTSWNAWSDRRLKKNIDNLNYGLNEILSLTPVRFNYKTDADDNANRLGFIAQDIQKYIPEIVNSVYENMLGLSMTDLIPVLVKAIQELKAEIDLLKAK